MPDVITPATTGNDPPPIRAASTIVLSADAVLLVKRAKGANAGLWSAPGGHAREGETAEETARRELAEETGLSIADLLPLTTLALTAPPPPGLEQDTAARHYCIEVFAAWAPAGTTPHAASDAADARFVAFADLPSLPTTPNLGDIIAAARRRMATVPQPSPTDDGDGRAIAQNRC